MRAMCQFFQLSANKTNIRTEIAAGVTTFLTMAYIIFVNPAILSEAGVPLSGAMFATCLAAAVGSLAMGLLANYPFALAPGADVLPPARHLGYAITWYGLALVLIVIYFAYHVSVGRLSFRPPAPPEN